MHAPVTLLIADPGAVFSDAPPDIREDLEILLSQADSMPLRTGGATRTLFALFGFDGAAELPAAAVTRAVDAGDAAGRTWLRADPVNMDVGSQLVLKARGEDLELSADESRELETALAEHFRETGLAFSAPHRARWYLALPGAEELETTPVDELAGRDCSDLLPGGPAADAWRRLLGEIQMLLHNHPVNRARRQAGRLPVNSLWFWGPGTLPGHVPGGFSRVIGSDAVARGLASLPVSPDPGERSRRSPRGGGSPPLAGARAGRRHGGALLLPDGGEEDAAVWRHWRAAKRAPRWVLVPAARRQFRLRFRHSLRFWRSRRDLASLLAPQPPTRP